ncbi:WD40 repeat-like protein [Cryphonectria parasitica EP155]|uniref:WD40 repeat-like protein n=1 Tax=Cryphonectria parasitica (strain ATCC 38755 / EP155) TaxID=660469 RepID=A0A9P5CQN4_CRYP1|nr:WD40 repeat-like protein [Cryphonectria parasitica EP155]KAF3767704.1 WD40 repeat-like protein [Cryphonectria parasitica EP155]
MASSVTVPKDVALPADAQDTVSSVSWSPTANHVAAASWDGKVRVYDVAADGSQARGLVMFNTGGGGRGAGGPVLSCDWVKDGTTLVAGGADKNIHLLHAATGQSTIIGTHDAPIRAVCRVDDDHHGSIICSGSWDRTVKFWDIRQPGSSTGGRPLGTLTCAERVYAMASASRALVIATADRHVHLVDLAHPTVFMRSIMSPLRHQTRAVAVAPDGKFWAAASIEGRCAISSVDEKESSTNFTFRCHRSQPEDTSTKTVKVFTVNDVQFHPAHPTTFTTAGSDGTFHFWDRVAHQRLRGYPAVGGAITTTAFNRDGSLFLYAVGYDWALGFAANSPEYPVRLMVHRVAEEDVKGKKG